MKKIYILALIVLSFVLGFFLSGIYFKNKFQTNDISFAKNGELNSGVYEDLSFGELRKDGGDYYIKFSGQQEDKVFPEYCYENGVFMDEKSDCFKTGRPLQDKINPDIDLSKEYKISKDGIIELITYENGTMTFSLNDISSYYRYINDESYELNHADITRNPKDYNFEVFMLNGEIVNLRQVYQE